jgi:hypothetical protein
LIVTGAVATAVEFAAEIAVTVTVTGAPFAGIRLGLIEWGAEYNPLPEIVPVVWLPPATPFTCHVTAEFELPVTVAVNACVANGATLAEVGEIEIAEVCVFPPLPPLLPLLFTSDNPLHPARTTVTIAVVTKKLFRRMNSPGTLLPFQASMRT